MRSSCTTSSSGLAERVFWWRLAAHGYGLIDDRAPGGRRTRPAYHALQTFLQMTATSTFRRLLATGDGACYFLFESNEGKGWALAYAHPRSVTAPPPFSFDHLHDHLGREQRLDTPHVTLTGRPVYFLNVRF